MGWGGVFVARGGQGTEIEAQARQGRPPAVAGKENTGPTAAHPQSDNASAAGHGGHGPGSSAGYPPHSSGPHPPAHGSQAHGGGGGAAAAAHAHAHVRRHASDDSAAGGAGAAGEERVSPVKRASVLSRWPPAAAGNA